MNVTKLREFLTTSWWVIPAAVVLVLVGLTAASLAIDVSDAEVPRLLQFSANASEARSMLSTMASSVLTFTGLTFSITIVVLTLASGQFSPRVLRTFLRDRPSQISLGVFVGTYVVNLVTLREVRSGVAEAIFVPELTVTFAFALTVASIGTFVFFVHHVAQSVRAATIIERVAATGRATIDRRFSDHTRAAAVGVPDLPVRDVISTTRAGVVIGVEHGALVELAREHDKVLRLRCQIGDFLPEGLPAIEVLGAGDGPPSDAVLNRLTLARERSERQDIGFVIRQLVDIAERALSPGINDPTTAVQSIDRIHDLLRRLAGRPFPSGMHADADGTVRLIAPEPNFAELLDLALDELRHWGADSLQVHRRIGWLLDDLATVVSDEARKDAIARQQQRFHQRRRQDLPEIEQPATTRGGSSAAPSGDGSARGTG